MTLDYQDLRVKFNQYVFTILKHMNDESAQGNHWIPIDSPPRADVEPNGRFTVAGDSQSQLSHGNRCLGLVGMETNEELDNSGRNCLRLWGKGYLCWFIAGCPIQGYNGPSAKASTCRLGHLRAQRLFDGEGETGPLDFTCRFIT
jgi:hypothetical protein